MSEKSSKKKIKKIISEGVVHIHASYNNTIVSIADASGDIIAWSTAGSSGFKGARKSTPYAAQVAAEKAVEKVKSYGLEKVSVKIKGIGPGREQAIRGLYIGGLDITAIIDVTPVPHNGCRRRRVRRV